MSMNIMNAEAHALAKDLAAIEHTTVTEAVVISLREALALRRGRATRERRLATMRRLSDAFAADLQQDPGAPSIWELSEALYGERGLPR
ncbi:MAG: type II toxin-antitoxin system VapB family antitoxin [Actinomycetales bacterium]|nr:type II toxin-antitoxin system VapB family antitoxin [Actinomycetales bacterium]